jgi:hypothetical protein
MSNPVKQNISSNLEKAKVEGKVRSEHIQEIVRDAVGLAIAELKEGTIEIRSIIKDAISTVISDLKGSGKETTERITASIEGAIEAGTSERQQAIAQKRSKLLEIQELLDQQQLDLEQEISGALIEIRSTDLSDSKTPNSDPNSDPNSEAINLAVDTVQERQSSGILQEQYLKLMSQLENLDQKLANRYGDRYDEIKQQLETKLAETKVWYDQKKTEADASGKLPLLQKQAEIEDNLGELGSVVARKEQEVTKRLQELWGDRFSSKS